MGAITPGKYRAKAVAHKLGKTSKGTEQVYIDFELTSGEHKGQHLPYYGYFTEATAERTLESLEYCGWDGNSLGEMRGLGSKEVELVVELERNDQDGKEYLRVKWVNRTGGGVKEELDRGGVASLEQRMKGLMLARKANNPNKSTPRERQPGEDNYDPDFGPTDYGDEPPV